MQTLELATNNQDNSAYGVMKRLSEGLLPYAKLVGRWVWVEFPLPDTLVEFPKSYAPTAELKAELVASGFVWNGKANRNCWQHNCGIKRRFSFRINPKQVYSVYNASDVI